MTLSKTTVGWKCHFKKSFQAKKPQSTAKSTIHEFYIPIEVGIGKAWAPSAIDNKILKNKLTSMKSGNRRSIEELHACIPIKKESVKNGTSDKAATVRGFTHFFKDLPQYIEQAHDGVSEDTMHAFENIISTSSSRREMVRRCCILTREQLKAACYTYLRTLEWDTALLGMQTDEFQSFKKLFARRIQKIRPLIDAEGSTVAQKQLNILGGLVLGGVANTAHVSWSYFNAIPDVVLREHNRPPSVDCYEQYVCIAETVQSLIMTIVSSHDDVFTTLNQIMRRPSVEKSPEDTHTPYDDGGEMDWPLYHSEDLCLREGALMLEQGIIDSTKSSLICLFTKGRLQLNEPRLGCAGMTLIPVVHKWCLHAAKQCFFKHAKRIHSLPREAPSRKVWIQS